MLKKNFEPNLSITTSSNFARAARRPLIIKKLFMSIIMPNPLTNQTEKNIAKDNIITDIKNLFRLKKKKG